MLHQRSRLHKAERQSINRHGRSRTEVRAADGDPPEGFKVGGPTCTRCLPFFCNSSLRSVL